MFKTKAKWDRAEIAMLAVLASMAALNSAVPAQAKLYTFPLVVLSAIAVGVCKFRSKKIEESEKVSESTAKAQREREHREEIEKLRKERDDVARKVATAILRVFWRRYFGKLPNPDHFKSRVTLFRKQNYADSSGSELVIFARHGRYSDSISRWKIDDNEPIKCEGIAGKIWALNSLDRFSADQNWEDCVTPELQTSFATALNATVAVTNQLNVKSRAFIGTTVMVKGSKWGVLLLDSQDPTHIKDSEHSDDLIVRYATVLGEVMGEIGQ